MLPVPPFTSSEMSAQAVAPPPFGSAASLSDMTDFLSSLAAAGFFSGDAFGGPSGKAFAGPSGKAFRDDSSEASEHEGDIPDEDDDEDSSESEDEKSNKRWTNPDQQLFLEAGMDEYVDSLSNGETTAFFGKTRKDFTLTPPELIGVFNSPPGSKYPKMVEGVLDLGPQLCLAGCKIVRVTRKERRRLDKKLKRRKGQLGRWYQNHKPNQVESRRTLVKLDIGRKRAGQAVQKFSNRYYDSLVAPKQEWENATPEIQDEIKKDVIEEKELIAKLKGVSPGNIHLSPEQKALVLKGIGAELRNIFNQLVALSDWGFVIIGAGINPESGKLQSSSWNYGTDLESGAQFFDWFDDVAELGMVPGGVPGDKRGSSEYFGAPLVAHMRNVEHVYAALHPMDVDSEPQTSNSAHTQNAGPNTSELPSPLPIAEPLSSHSNPEARLNVEPLPNPLLPSYTAPSNAQQCTEPLSNAELLSMFSMPEGLDSFANFLPPDWEFSDISASGNSVLPAETSTAAEQNLPPYSDASFMDLWSQSGSPDTNASNLSDSFSLSFVDNFIRESSSSASAPSDSPFLFNSDLSHSAVSPSSATLDFVSNHSPTISNNPQTPLPVLASYTPLPHAAAAPVAVVTLPNNTNPTAAIENPQIGTSTSATAVGASDTSTCSMMRQARACKPTGLKEVTTLSSTDQGPPSWQVRSFETMKDPALGQEWAALLENWYTFETCMSRELNSGKLPASKIRPKTLTTWLDGTRSFDIPPLISDSRRFAKCMMAWWNTLQPIWRQTAIGLPISDYSKPLTCLRKGGQNGIITILFGLFWWGRLGEERSQWLLMVADVDRTIQALLQQHVPTKRHR
ncbi:uncharacterized protein ARMOST_16809 [Armillaria ostoyae]|uniref:Uncharacterized protein n=1 Tax=Armillaria ostoyae TaxID=47428 RepID=A0A284RX80_ARMOS|nr:uncharacterized protein ARMOST_16809 [Armillaria ostoyae]